MLNYINAEKKNFFKQLELFLNKRRRTDSIKNSKVKKIIKDVIKNQDKALIKYEKSNAKTLYLTPDPKVKNFLPPFVLCSLK